MSSQEAMVLTALFTCEALKGEDSLKSFRSDLVIKVLSLLLFLIGKYRSPIEPDSYSASRPQQFCKLSHRLLSVHQWDAFRNCHKIGLTMSMGIDHIREILCSALVKCDGGTIDPLLGYIDVEFAGITCHHPVEAFR